MKSLIRRIKQRFCCHEDYPDYRNYAMPFLGYAFQCPQCKGYVAYFKEWGDYLDISKKKYELFTNEGNKLREKLPKYWEDN